MSTPIQTYREGEKDFNEKFQEDSEYRFSDKEGYYQHKSDIQSHTKHRIIQLLESEIEWIGGDEENLHATNKGMITIGINQERQRIRTHLTDLITQIKNNE